MGRPVMTGIKPVLTAQAGEANNILVHREHVGFQKPRCGCHDCAQRARVPRLVAFRQDVVVQLGLRGEGVSTTGIFAFEGLV